MKTTRIILNIILWISLITIFFNTPFWIGVLVILTNTIMGFKVTLLSMYDEKFKQTSKDLDNGLMEIKKELNEE